jgi:hypothetical protein
VIEALRVSWRNGWKLLRVDYQRTLEDIFVSEDYEDFFPYTTKIGGTMR